jgi:hypothetical protein
MRKSYDIPPTKFVCVWQLARSAQEAADKLNMPKAIVLAHASNYRAHGVHLKHMPRGRLDVDSLNAFIEGLRPSKPERGGEAA